MDCYFQYSVCVLNFSTDYLRDTIFETCFVLLQVSSHYKNCTSVCIYRLFPSTPAEEQHVQHAKGR